jgi:hypothetical protein
VSSATEKAKRERLARTRKLFATHQPPAGTWQAITCKDFDQARKAAGGDDLPFRECETRLNGGPTLRVYDTDAGPVLATLQFVGAERCHHMRHVGGSA